MSYDLPVAVDTFPRTFAVPAAQIPAGLATTEGLPFLQFNQHRCGLWLVNNAAAGSFVWISENKFGFATAFPIQGSAFLNVLEFPYPPRIQMFAWTTGTAPDFRYMEFVYQPFRQGVAPEKGGGVRSNP